jgi:3',5'-cyclic AMP phosphodiesterase CpdA
MRSISRPAAGLAVLVAQLSDLHVVEAGEQLFGRIDTERFLVEAIATVESLDPRPDLVLISGDLVNEGRTEQYRNLRRLLAALTVPVRLMCGNHDDPDHLREVFPDHDYLGTSGSSDFVVDLAPLRIVALDTRVAGAPRGDLNSEQLAWLDERLAEASDGPCVVAMHHPPFATGIGHMDAMGLAPAAAAGLAEVVARHPHVERVVCGHLHRSITRRFAGTVAMTVPSCAHAVALDLRDGTPEGASDFEPPSVALHHWHPEHGLVTHLLPIGDFPRSSFGHD